MGTPKVSDGDQAEAKAALRAVIDLLLNGGLQQATAIAGKWRADASREPTTGYHIHLRWVG